MIAENNHFLKNNRIITSIIATLAYVIIIMLILFLVKFHSTKVEDIEEGEGLTVDFGYTENGFGAESLASQKQPNITIPEPGNPPIVQDIKPDDVLVQDIEETILEPLKSNDKKIPKKIAIVESALKQKISTNKKETKEKIKYDNTENNIKEKIDKNGLFGGFKSNGKGKSNGNTTGNGDMGNINGTSSDNFQNIPSGEGSKLEGRGMIGSGLGGRKLDFIPKIYDKSNKNGKIIIKVKVDNLGNVINSDLVVKGSNIIDNDLVDKCKNASMKAKFSPKNESDEADYGTLIFNFVVK